MARPEAATPGRTGSAGDDLVLFDFAEGSPDADPERFSNIWGELNDVAGG